jgi:hypothetical protein
LLTLSFKVLPALNLITLDAAILMAAPVEGLRPLRAARFLWLKVPNPTKVTELPFVKDLQMFSRKEAKALPAAALEISASADMCSISSVLFIYAPNLIKEKVFYGFFSKTYGNHEIC